MGRENNANRYHWHAGVKLTEYGPHWVFLSPRHVLSRSTLLRLHGALQGHCPKQALHFMYFPRSELLKFKFLGTPQGHRLGWECILCPSQVWADQATRCLARAPSQLCSVSPLGSWSQAVTFLAYVNQPGSQEDVVSNWEPAQSLMEDVSFWGQDFPLPSGFVCSAVPASLPLYAAS